MNRTMSRFVEIQSISDTGTALVKFRDEKSAVKALIRINNMEIKGKKYTSNKIHYYSYRAFSGQNKKRVFHALCDKDGNNVIDVNLSMFRNIIARAIICDLNIAR